MKLSSNNLIGLVVFTESGRRLGRVNGFNLETDSQSVLEYKIKPSGLVRGLVGGQLIISRGQVLDISQEKMTVEDLVPKSKVREKVKDGVKEKAAQGAVMKEKKIYHL